jgi:cell shape-determining protein MreD
MFKFSRMTRIVGCLVLASFTAFFAGYCFDVLQWRTTGVYMSALALLFLCCVGVNHLSSEK